MDEFDAMIGCAVRWTCVGAMFLGVWYWLAQFLWGRMTTAWKLATLNVLRRDAIKAHIKDRAK